MTADETERPVGKIRDRLERLEGAYESAENDYDAAMTLARIEELRRALSMTPQAVALDIRCDGETVERLRLSEGETFNAELLGSDYSIEVRRID